MSAHSMPVAFPLALGGTAPRHVARAPRPVLGVISEEVAALMREHAGPILDYHIRAGLIEVEPTYERL